MSNEVWVTWCVTFPSGMPFIRSFRGTRKRCVDDWLLEQNKFYEKHWTWHQWYRKGYRCVRTTFPVRHT